MRKLFMFAVAAFVMLATSCAKDDVSDPQVGGDQLVSFSVSTPELATRAISDGETAKNLTVTVYEKDVNGSYVLLEQLTKTATFTDLKATVDFRLVTGKTYCFAFWAQAEGAPYTFDYASATISVDYSGKANNEARDAFFAYRHDLLVDGAISETVTLKRPFAQLNVATADWAEALESKIEVKTTNLVVLENIYTKLNLLSGEVSEPISSAIELTANTIPAGEDANATAVEQLEGYETYRWLSMNYLLVNEKELTQVCMLTNDTDVEEKNWTNVPLQRNYRTNILGNILTSQVDFNIEINPIFDGGYDYVVSAEKDLKKMVDAVAGEKNPVISLTEDAEIDVKDALLAIDNTTVETLTIVGNGRTLTAKGVGHRGIEAGSNAKVIYKDLVFVDQTKYLSENGETAWEFCYLELGGNLRFENCVFDYTVMFDGPATEVVDCVFNGKSTNEANKENEYAAWVYSGVASFLNSQVNGYRGIKIADMYSDSDVTEVVIDGCTFTDLEKKPGVAIDENIGEEMAVTIKNSYFVNCQPGDQSKYIYETDNVEPTLENNVVTSNAIVTSQAAFETALADGGDILLAKAEGTRAEADYQWKNPSKPFRIIGVEEDVVIKMNNTTNNSLCANNKVAVEFENVTLQFNNVEYSGFHHSTLESYKNCVIEGYLKTYAPKVEFVGCNFVQTTADKYSLNVYGRGDVFISDSKFNGTGKGMYVYSETAGEYNVTIENTDFIASETIVGKAAVQMHTEKSIYGKLALNNVTATGFDSSINGGLYNELNNVTKELTNNFTKIINGQLNVTIDNEEDFKEVIVDAGKAGAGNTTITITKDLDMSVVADWEPINVDGYHGADIVTIEGNGTTITGLKGALFAGGFAGGSGIVIKNLTIEGAEIVADNTQGYGAFVNCADSMDEITLINCHLLNSSIITPNDGQAESRIGGLIGWTAGYGNPNDGPVDSYITVKDCSVKGCTLKGFGSIGGIVGHAGANKATYTIIEECEVVGNTFISTDDGGWRVGVVVGTANNGQCEIKNITESGNTLKQENASDVQNPTGDKRNYFGRFVPAGTGSLVIDGVVF